MSSHVPTSRVRNKKEGQILILMALMSTTLIILFGMVVGIGHLVQAKLNLQNAVDMAAMAGASKQARYLNEISLINYRMRQNYKFTLYDLYVTQSRFNVGVKRQIVGPVGTFDRIDSTRPGFGICQQSTGYCGKASIFENPECFSPTTDMCQNVDLTLRTIPGIVPSPVVDLNPILLATNALVTGLAATARRYCNAAAGQNMAYFNYTTKRLDDQERFQMTQIVQVLKAFNQAFSGDPGGSLGNGDGDAAVQQTFLGNLISANSFGNPTLEYLNDPATRTFNLPSSELNNLDQSIFATALTTGVKRYFDRQSVRFRIKVIDFLTGSDSSCSPRVLDATYGGQSGDGVFLGLARARSNPLDPSSPVAIPFNIALKATVKPNLLFWPRGATPTLVAVGAAKPFGSRIGPSGSQTNVEVAGSQVVTNYVLANMSFYPGDNVANTGGELPGMGHKSILKYLYNALPSPAIGKNELRPSTVNPAGQTCTGGAGATLPFLCLSLAPTLYEGMFWNAFPFSGYGPSAAEEAFGPYGTSIFHAFPGDVGIQTASAGVYDMPDRMITSGNTDSWHATTYIGDEATFQVNGKPAFFASAESALSSWSPNVKVSSPGAPLNVSELRAGGRMGYQIKLVGLKDLCKEMQDGGEVGPGALAPYCGADVFH